jgi:predicted amidohydrolase
MGAEPGVCLVDLDLSQVAETRARIPNLRHARQLAAAEVADAR